MGEGQSTGEGEKRGREGAGGKREKCICEEDGGEEREVVIVRRREWREKEQRKREER